NWFDVDGIFNRHQDTRTNQDLPWLSFVAKPRRDIGYRSDGGVIETALKANGAQRRARARYRRQSQAHAPADAISQSTHQSPYASQAPSARPAGPGLGQESDH